jgi:hypothetical protein
VETDFQVSGKPTYGVEAAIRANLVGSISRENIHRYEFFQLLTQISFLVNN